MFVINRKILVSKIFLVFFLTLASQTLLAHPLLIETEKARSVQEVSLQNGVMRLQGSIDQNLLFKIFDLLIKNSTSPALRAQYLTLSSIEQSRFLEKFLVKDFSLDQFPFPDKAILHTLELHSTGGDLIPAKKIVEITQYLKLTTTIPNNHICYSACALIFSTGSLRVAGENALIMFHRVRREYRDGTPCSSQHSHEYCETIGRTDLVEFANNLMESYLPRHLYRKIKEGREVTLPSQFLNDVERVDSIQPCLNNQNFNLCLWDGYNSIRIH